MTATKKELVLAAVFLCLIPVIAEIGLRLAGTQFSPVLYVANRQRGWTLRPGAEGVFDGETRQFVRINSHGFHDRERTYAKPPDVFRIAILGSSWTEALQVPLERTYPALLERVLNERGCFAGKRVQVLNFGVAGYSTAQEVLLLKQEVWRYSPDIVILAFYSARDVANNVRQLNDASDPQQSPYFVYRGGQLVLDKSFESVAALQPRQMQISKAKIALEQHFRVLQAINSLVQYVNTRTAIEMARDRTAGSPKQPAEDAVYGPPVQQQMEQAWSVTEGLMLAMKQEAEAHGAQFRIVTLANRPQVNPDPVQRTAFMRDLGVTDLSYADKRVAALGQRESIPVLQLAPALSEYAIKNHVYLNGFGAGSWGEGHWNETGHRLAAETIADDLCSQSKPAQQLTASVRAHVTKTGDTIREQP